VEGEFSKVKHTGRSRGEDNIWNASGTCHSGGAGSRLTTENSISETGGQRRGARMTVPTKGEERGEAVLSYVERNNFPYW